MRGTNGYRIYTEEDVRLFDYLKLKVGQGFSIGELAEIGRETLLEAARNELIKKAAAPPASEGLISDLIQALKENDLVVFEQKLNGALAVIPFEEALHRFLLPLQVKVGQLWHEGRLGVAEEHYASNQVKQKIISAMNQVRVLPEGPSVVVACPSQEWHEIAALTAAYLFAIRGCRVHYLGANLPIPDLASYCERARPSLVLLSMTVERSEEELAAIIDVLVTRVKPFAMIGMGGRYTIDHARIFSSYNIAVFPDLKSLDSLLASLTHS